MLEQEYYRWQKAVEDAQKAYEANPSVETDDQLSHALFWYRDTCTKILEQLMVDNADILKRLKEC